MEKCTDFSTSYEETVEKFRRKRLFTPEVFLCYNDFIHQNNQLYIMAATILCSDVHKEGIQNFLTKAFPEALELKNLPVERKAVLMEILHRTA